MVLDVADMVRAAGATVCGRGSILGHIGTSGASMPATVAVPVVRFSRQSAAIDMVRIGAVVLLHFLVYY